MTGVKGHLSGKFRERAKRPEHLERLLGSLESKDVETLPLAERSKLIAHLTRAVFQEAAEGKIWYDDEDAGCARIYEPPFAREIGQIVRLLNSFRLSDYTMQWAKTRAREFAAALNAELPYKKTEEQWPSLSMEEKTEILRKVAALQYRVFSKGAMSFLPSRVVLQSRHDVLGFIEPKLMDLQTLTVPDLNINENAVRHGSFLTAAVAVVHEQVHSMFMQLAIGAHRSQIGPQHPMAQDAEKFLARVRYSGFGAACIKSAYDSDPEEKITHAAHRAFSDGYSRAPTILGRARERAVGLLPWLKSGL